MSRLYIAEKPSLGRAIAAVLPKPHKKGEGYIELGNGDTVTWCVGHLLEQVEPEHYDAKYKTWRLEHLPIEVDQWQLKARRGMAKQLATIKRLMKQASELVHAGDPDREGQLLVDEVIDHLGGAAARQGVKRLLIADLNPAAVTRALGQLKDNRDYAPLSQSALARSRADWLYGMNLTRAYTLLGQKAGYRGVLSVGRVQTPVLGLVVRRDAEIAAFEPRPFYQLDALIEHPKGTIAARWQPSEACAQWQDDEGRLLSRKLVEHVAGRIQGQPAQVTDSQHKEKPQGAPLPYSLSALQIDAAKRFGMSASEVLACAQKLYEGHQLITYPRSDCRYLPKGHWQEAKAVSDAIAATDPSLTEAVAGADLSLKSRAFNDAKVGAHHAIIPTPKSGKLASLSAKEAKVYQLIARQYLMQFYPAARYAESRLAFEIAGGQFVAKGRVLTAPGWRALLGRPDRNDRSELNEGQGGDPSTVLPRLQVGEQWPCVDSRIKDCMTEPPKAFTEASLLQAMTGIARFVQDASLKGILKETDGLGTEATRAGIIELLFKRGFLLRQGKAIHSSDAGKGLIGALPEQATYPDMTARWEHELQAMAERQRSYSPFMADLTGQIAQLVDQVRTAPPPSSLAGLKSAPPRRRRRGKTGASRSGAGTRRPRSRATG
ncbi:DNA topoisomerase III [Ferrimonas marina]|uniref:DNA topoisomerase 3 n=1 Tax=Ferrimonas marina TaxID=299255 RepID=A0A1M5MI55_9GAMM|nr:DNA topoisomerase III [Ferrimonas marina]SHG76413.1 DNA topoisomerase-3 [Ferrimonas marina]